MYEMDIQNHRQTGGERFKDSKLVFYAQSTGTVISGQFKDRDKDRLTGDTEPKTDQPSGQMRQFAAPSKST